MIHGASSLLLVHMPSSGQNAGICSVEAIFPDFLRVSALGGDGTEGMPDHWAFLSRLHVIASPA